MIGETLSHYRITDRLGAGGMGEVYRAEDTTLGRDVAIKVLPESFASDPERLARFEREAKLLASLNHPNIAAIHGFEQHEGTRFLVLELAEGEDLSERLKRGPIPVDDAVDIAAQIAEALEEAHEKGIVHRDLKPGNVKLAPDGKVKVLDFGLAKAWAGDPATSGSGTSVDLSQSPTLAHTGTQAGIILGTAAYMSPEQARGKPVDKRADTWSFGVVVFEMLTGRRLFEGETVSDVLASVLKTPPEWDRLPGSTPLRLRRLLERCLERDPRSRLRDIGEARILLAEKLEGSEPLPPAAARTSWVTPLGWVVAAASLLVAAALAWRGGPGDASSAGPLHLQLDTAPSNVAHYVALSPDGMRVAFVGWEPEAAEAVYVRSLREPDARRLPGTDGAMSPAFSPDGEWLAYRHGIRALAKVPVQGGAVVRLAEGDYRYASVAWLDDGRILLAALDPGLPGLLFAVPASGGSPTPLPAAPGTERQRVTDLDPLPGSRHVVLRLFEGERSAIAIQSLETGERRVLAQDGRDGRVVGRHLVWWAPNGLVAARLNAEAMTLSGEPASVALAGIDPRIPPDAFDVSATGTLVVRPGLRGGDNGGEGATTGNRGATTGNRLVWLDRDGGRSPAPGGENVAGDPRLAPGGGRVAVGRDTGGDDVWTIDLNRGAASRLTLGEGEDETGVWSPDGSWIAWASQPIGAERSLLRRRSDGSGEIEKLWSSERHFHAGCWTPDGAAILLGIDTPDAGWDVWLVSLDGETPVRRLLSEAFDETSPRVSPDGRWVVYVSDESGSEEVYVQSFPGLGDKLQISVGGGVEPVWNPVGGEIVYRSPATKQYVRVGVATEGALAPETPTAIASDVDFMLSDGDHTSYDVAPDGRLLVIERNAGSEDAPLRIVLGWARAAGLLE